MLHWARVGVSLVHCVLQVTHDMRRWLPQLVGTPQYMSPELILGYCSDPRASDVWALGCTLLELATGSVPWSSVEVEDSVALMRHIASSGTPPPSSKQLAPGLTDMLSRCFLPETQRPSAAELLHHAWLSQSCAPPRRIRRRTVLLPTIPSPRVVDDAVDVGCHG